MGTPERFHVVVVGGGQSGLSVGYHLSRRAIPYVILDSHSRVGDAWRNRWDSLRLFTPARFDGLDGLPFPGDADRFVTKDEMADYLEAYAKRFDLNVHGGVTVEQVARRGTGWAVTAGDSVFEADHVVVAMSNYQKRRVPPFARELDGRIRQLHSEEYKSPAQLAEGGVLVVGAGNSGAEIALEVARTRPTWLSGPSPGAVPFRMDSFLGRLFLQRLLLRGVFHRLLTVDTPLGRKARPKMMARATPLIRTREEDLAAAGVARVGRTVGVKGGRPLLSDGTVLDVSSVIWCTGFHPGLSWVDAPVLDGRGEPVHERGLVPAEPGLAFVGQHFLYAMSSSMVHGVGRDAERIAEAIARRAAA
jgi:putative flavoprotein involved in K+ transport